MAAWVEWLAGLVSGLLPPAPGTHEAVLEEYRAGGQLRKELDKPPGQQDEELVHRLRLRYRTHQMRNVRAIAHSFGTNAASFEQPADRACCAAVGWVRQRVAASYRALADYHWQWIRQVEEEHAAARARRPSVIVARPALRL
ncbi:hypothetical protein C2E20_5510 [Micractinium conductrix]|uniref:Uncharacterized protein n=1 Tax=Micractinium conductrix TaxID=554055 RepID=A0A2P6VAU8_9CHLO|nr:hypothetical protein C2E20_5510 [Micractinium conductrix]|eukprot:PSC71195.1 hypothetical protein C2E20_5510 [Micractinium conductrix]